MTATLRRPVLVLNRSWQAIHIVDVERALIMVAKQVAKFVDVEDMQMLTWDDWSQVRPAAGDAYLQSVNVQLRVPEVVVLTRYDKMPRRKVTFSRRNVYQRDGYRCQYCGCQPGAEELTIDHVVPRASGGVSSWVNCVLACIGCNKRKADRSLKAAGMKLKHEPVVPAWRPVYADHRVRLDSWSKFVSEAYWGVPLQK